MEATSQKYTARLGTKEGRAVRVSGELVDTQAQERGPGAYGETWWQRNRRRIGK